MECGADVSVSMFLKWMRSLSPTRALTSGPGMRVATGLPQSRVKRA